MRDGPAARRNNNALGLALAALGIVLILAALASGALGVFGGTAEVEEDTSKGGAGTEAAPTGEAPEAEPGSLRVPRDRGLTDRG